MGLLLKMVVLVVVPRDITGLMVAFVPGIICGLIAWICLDKRRTERFSVFLGNGDGETDFAIPEFWIRTISLAVSVISICAAYQTWMNVSNPLNRIRLYIAMACLTGSACVDFREHRIPNCFSAAIAISSILLLGLGYLTGLNGALSYITGAAFASICTALFMTIASFLTKNGIGLGDIKLLAALSLSGGVLFISKTMFFGTFFSAFAALYMVLIKKKNTKETIPFGPFIWLGAMITMLWMEY